ncbi:MAG: three-Cys-motif partner protein TcmP [SAR202 cluster bacterium]|nr:three-Cys-motif partner protein TcmP [SAR202 cluster bacterium]
MAAPKTTIWELEPHSRAKHEILRRYLQAWVVILGQGGFREFAYIDGFAGPGRYSKGEDGSPIIALKVALEHQTRIDSGISFLFVENRPDRAEVLQEILDETDRPNRYSVRVAKGSKFDDEARKFLDEISSKSKNPPPIFAFIDPFGWSGVSFKIVQRIMGFPSCEVLVTFMYEEINRFIGHPEQEDNFDEFFGTTEWRDAITIQGPAQRNRFLHDLYGRQLRESAKVRYVRSFQMRNDRDVTDYYLFYGTNSLLGLKKMKEAMWRLDASGEFRFSDATDPQQLVLFSKEPQYDLLKDLVIKRFQGLETTVAVVEEFVVTETPFRETHYKTQVLKPLELSNPPGLLVVNSPAGRRPGTYSDRNLRLRIL